MADFVKCAASFLAGATIATAAVLILSNTALTEKNDSEKCGKGDDDGDKCGKASNGAKSNGSGEPNLNENGVACPNEYDDAEYKECDETVSDEKDEAGYNGSTETGHDENAEAGSNKNDDAVYGKDTCWDGDFAYDCGDGKDEALN